MTSAADRLINKRISESLIDDIIVQAVVPVPASVIERLRTPVEAQTDLDELRATVRALAGVIPDDLYRLVREDLAMIADDVLWLRQPGASDVLTAQDWIFALRDDFSATEAFRDIELGAHTSEPAVMVLGNVDTQADFERLIAFLQDRRPPFDLRCHVLIGANHDDIRQAPILTFPPAR